MGNVRIGRNVVIRRAVIDKGNCIPDGLKIGEDPEQDRRLFTISAGGIAVVPKGMPLFRP
jgi:glucose-1-phosphate adenylyltransferase